jgi:hypothetical protein
MLAGALNAAMICLDPTTTEIYIRRIQGKHWLSLRWRIRAILGACISGQARPTIAGIPVSAIAGDG